MSEDHATEVECAICGDSERGPWLARIEGVIVCKACNDSTRHAITGRNVGG